MIWSDVGVKGHLFGPVIEADEQVISKCCDFIVIEKINVKKGVKHPLYLLVKEKIDTLHALFMLRKELRCKEISYCGLKDKYSLSIQNVVLINCHRYPSNVVLDKIIAKKIDYVDKPLRLGENTYNDFIVRIKENNVDELVRFLEKSGRNLLFPNYIGYQRFGIRKPYTHELGLAYLKYQLGDEGELNRLLSGRTGWWEQQFLSEGYMDESIKALLTQSVQAYYFNECLSEILLEKQLKVNKISSGVLIGYDFYYKEHPSWVNKNHLDCIKNKLSKDNWIIQALEKLRIKTRYRALLSVAEILTFKLKKESLVIAFRLNPGVYGTVFLRELVGDKGSLFQDCDPCLKTMV